jgi:L-alanine-DL-glutamate epimerase-like enolase superfamily enzyme
VRIDAVVVRRLSLPLRQPFETSFGRTTSKEFLLVSVSSEGVTGHAECVADTDPFYLPETNATALHILRDFLVPLAFALEITDPRDVAPAFGRVRGHEMAKAALEMAVWELMARREGVPLCRPGSRSACRKTCPRSWPRSAPSWRPATAGSRSRSSPARIGRCWPRSASASPASR